MLILVVNYYSNSIILIKVGNVYTAKNLQLMGGERAVDWQKAHRHHYQLGYLMFLLLTLQKFKYLRNIYSFLVVFFFFFGNFDICFSSFPVLDVNSASDYIYMFHDCAN